LCVQTDINICKIANRKERPKKGQTGRNTLRRRRFALGCSAIEEEEEEEEEEERKKKKKGRKKKGRRRRRRKKNKKKYACFETGKV